MKEIILIFVILTLISCNKDDASSRETNEFLDSLISRYELQAIYTDVPLDLNNDGISQTDLWAEADCFVFDTFGVYMAEFTYNELYDYRTFWIELPSSHYVLETESYESCLVNESISYEYDVNEDTKEVIVTYRDEEREALHGVLTDIKWEDDVLYVTYSKDLYTSDGWQHVNLSMEYLKIELHTDND